MIRTSGLIFVCLLGLSSCKKMVNMTEEIKQVNEKILQVIHTTDAVEFNCQVFDGSNKTDWGNTKCFAVKTPRDDAAALIMAAVDGYVQTASWQDDYGALHTTYQMKHDPAYKIAFDVGHTGANGDLLKEQGIDPKVYRTTIMYIPPSKDK